MAATISPVSKSDVTPVAQDPPNRGTSRALVLCGRSVKNCCAHTAFIAGYGVSGCMLALSIWNQSLVIGILSGVVALPITITHVCWSRYSNIANAAEDVDDAARGAKEAAGRVQTAVAGTIQTSSAVSKSAERVELAAGHIQVVVDGAHINSLQADVASFKESAEVLTRENIHLTKQLAELKGIVTPIMGLIGSFRSSLSELKGGIKAASPLLASFTSIEERFAKVASTLEATIQGSSTSIQSIIEEAAQTGIAFMQVIDQKNRSLLEELHKVNTSLQSTSAEVAGLVTHIAKQDGARKDLLAELESQREKNGGLQQRLEEVLKAIEAERRGYQEERGAGVTSSPTREVIATQIQTLENLTKIMKEIKQRLLQPQAGASI